jgi:site-specific DNA-methyltransferase (adenine-specific)
MAYVRRDLITKNTNLIDRWKVLVPKAYGAGESFPHQILGKPEVGSPPSACTGSFLVISADSKRAAESIESYYRTKFFRFMVSLRKITQDAFSHMYTWVPQQTWDREWTDKDLYKKYKLTKEEIEFIESKIRLMEVGDDKDD